MKMTLSGDPQEVAAFLQQLQFQHGVPGGVSQLLETTSLTQVQPKISIEPETPEDPTETKAQILETERSPAIKDRIVSFLEQRGRATSREISIALGMPRTKISRRISTLEDEGVIFRDGSKARNNDYGLVGREHVRPETSAIPVEQHNQYLGLMGALEERPNATVIDLQSLTGIPPKTIQMRLGEMIERDWIKETTQNKSRNKRFVAKTITRKTQAPAFVNFRTAVLNDIEQHPGTTTRSVSKRLLKSHNDVAARMVMLAKAGELRHDGEADNRRWFAGSAQGEPLAN